MNKKPFVIFLVGPTGVGKSAVAMEVAKKVRGEIISADSMQVYQQMDIGTGKPSKSDLRKIPHHLISVIPPARNFSVFQYRSRAIRTIKDVLKRGRVPVMVGGSGLYVRSLLEGLSEQPAGNRAIRLRLEREIKEKGLLVLYERLCELDARAAAKIKPQDARRIIRALERIELSGQRLTDGIHHQKSLSELGFNPVVFGIIRERSELYRRIEARVDQMFRRGWAAEVRAFIKGRISRTASQALGYREIQKVLRESAHKNLSSQDLEMVKSLIKQNTRRFAKRQITWFKREKGIQWICWEPNESVKQICDKILAGSPFYAS